MAILSVRLSNSLLSTRDQNEEQQFSATDSKLPSVIRRWKSACFLLAQFFPLEKCPGWSHWSTRIYVEEPDLLCSVLNFHVKIATNQTLDEPPSHGSRLWEPTTLNASYRRCKRHSPHTNQMTQLDLCPVSVAWRDWEYFCSTWSGLLVPTQAYLLALSNPPPPPPCQYICCYPFIHMDGEAL